VKFLFTPIDIRYLIKIIKNNKKKANFNIINFKKKYYLAGAKKILYER